MGDKITIIDTSDKKSRLESFLKSFSISFDVIANRLGPVSKDKNIYQAIVDLKNEVTTGLAAVAAEIAKLQPPTPPPAQTKGTLMARYRIPADSPDITFELVGSGFADSKGNPTGAADIDLSIESGGDAVIATMGEQRLSEDGQQVIAPVTLSPNTTSLDFVAVTYKATNRDTGAVVAADADEFVVGPGEASIGTLDSPVPLTAEEEPPTE